MKFIPFLFQCSIAQIELEQALAALQNLFVWGIVVVPSIIATYILGCLVAKGSVRRADDPVRAAINALLLAACVWAIVAGLAAYLWPAIGGNLSAALAVGFLVLVVNGLLAGILYWLDPATRAGY